MSGAVIDMVGDGDGLDLRACDREPIHIPGAIQPHGALLGVDGEGVIRAASGRTGDFFGAEPGDLLGRPLTDIFREPLPGAAGFAGTVRTQDGRDLDLTRHAAGELELLEFEPLAQAPLTGVALLQALETATSALDSADSVDALCERAAGAFRRLTGFDRVMIYRFLEGGAGRVVGESKQPNLHAFLNHHFPASDIPQQARALYLRNLTRIIPDSAYEPAPILAQGIEPSAIDLSDSVLRSVSPIHLEYLQNMGVAASASVSIVVDGALWGLAALHNMTPRLLPNEARAVCRMLAGVLARRLKHFADVEAHAERTRLMGVREAMLADLARRGDGVDGLGDHLLDLIDATAADGVALCLGDRVLTAGSTPPPRAIPALRDFALDQAGEGVWATDRLGEVHEPALAWSEAASGLLVAPLPGTSGERSALIWFRAEQIETVRWAGDPHKAVEHTPGARLNPRTSFEEWKQTVRGRSARWTPMEIEAAGRLGQEIGDLGRSRDLHRTAEELAAQVAQRDEQLAQKDYLLKEVNHRIQNNLQLVASFLSLQRRETQDEGARAHLDEAMRRMRAVGLVHRRLYHSDVVESVDMDRYLEELIAELRTSLGPEWGDLLKLEAVPVQMATDRAVAVGLVLTELVINVAKYAYEGRPGPLHVGLTSAGREMVLTVSDQGRGRPEGGSREGFGTRMMKALVAQIGGSLAYVDANPGARAVMTAPLV